MEEVRKIKMMKPKTCDLISPESWLSLDSDESGVEIEYKT